MKHSRFFTETGIAVHAVTADQMEEVDRIALEETGPNLFQMMENAGRNLALEVIEVLGNGWESAQIAVLAGGGGNGGGGICAARHLANRNAQIALCLANPNRLLEVTAFQHTIYRSANGAEIFPENITKYQADLIIDALVGYRLTGASF